MSEIGALKQELWECSLTPSACEDREMMAMNEPGSGLLPDVVQAGDFLFECPTFRMVRNKFLSLIHHLVYGILLQQS